MKAVICPICEGEGNVKDKEIQGSDVVKIITRLCHGCGGKGWVEIKGDEYIDLEEELTGKKTEWGDRCPICGGLRSQSGLTGCGFNHYGTYCFINQN